MRDFRQKHRDKDFLFFLLIFLILPNLICYGASSYIGSHRPLFFIDYLFAAIPLCLYNRRSAYIYSSIMLCLYFFADLVLIFLEKFNFNLAQLAEILQFDFITFGFVKNLIKEFLSHDVKHTIIPLQTFIYSTLSLVVLGLILTKIINKKFELRAFFKIIFYPTLFALFNFVVVYFIGPVASLIISSLTIIILTLINFRKIEAIRIHFSFVFLAISLSFIVMGGFIIKNMDSKFYLADILFDPTPKHEQSWDGMYEGGFHSEKYDVPAASTPLFKKLDNNTLDYDKVFVTVAESFGAFKDANSQEAIYSALNDSELKEHYTVTKGELEYPNGGNTLAAEFRCLCRLKQYRSLPSKKDKPFLQKCLPVKMKAAGYRTTGIHNAAGKYYDRENLYPLLDWDEILFQENITRKYSLQPTCGTSFPGICEKDMYSKVIYDIAKTNEKDFVYFMTVEGHMPVNESLPIAPEFQKLCDKDKIMKNNHTLCSFSAVHNRLLGYVKDLAIKIKDKHSIFIIVGDHKPPFYYNKYSDYYKTGIVPYVIIESKK